MKNMIENMSKNTKLSVLAVIVVVIVALIVRFSNKKQELPVELPLNEPIVQEVSEVPTKYRARNNNNQPSLETETTVATPIDSRSYTDLIVEYKGKTLQFGDMCQVRLSSQVYKSGSEILIDNRNDFSVSIKLGSDTYQLSPYGYKVISVNTEGNFMVDCGIYQNVATVIVQK